MGPFEISKEVVASLSDELLRTLLDKLLTAEALMRSISPAGIAVDGNQTAGDGGLDASIGWKGQPAPRDWLPRRTIFFQCIRPICALIRIRSRTASSCPRSAHIATPTD